MSVFGHFYLFSFLVIIFSGIMVFYWGMIIGESRERVHLVLSEKGRQDFQCLLQLFISGVVEQGRDHGLSLRRVFNLNMREHLAQIQIQASGQIDQGI